MVYKVLGEQMPVVICQLDRGESVNCEAGAMSWMTDKLDMKTQGGGAKKMLGRMFSGESMFLNTYTAKEDNQEIAFATSFPGEIRVLEITPESPIIVQKSGFLAADPGVELSVFFQKKGMTGIFGGEGFIMQKLSGKGTAFVELDGSIIEYNLGKGEKIVCETGSLAMVDASCSIDIVRIKGVKNMLFGGEGLFNTVITGPGKVYLQTMPISNLAGRIAYMIPTSSN